MSNRKFFGLFLIGLFLVFGLYFVILKFPQYDFKKTIVYDVDEVIDNTSKFFGQEIKAKGKFTLNDVVCTQQFCPPSQPCCNTCSKAYLHIYSKNQNRKLLICNGLQPVLCSRSQNSVTNTCDYFCKSLISRYSLNEVNFFDDNYIIEGIIKTVKNPLDEKSLTNCLDINNISTTD